jgi:cysteine desulfurase/selenocysteine lyase
LREATWADLPARFEAGTPAIAEAIGLGAAAAYLSSVGMEAIWAHGQNLVAYAMARLSELPGVRLIGPPAEERGSLITFLVDGIHPHDLSQVLDGEGIAIRAGYHCAEPLHAVLGIGPTARASFYLYNTKGEIDRLAAGIQKAQNLLLRGV